MGSQEKKRKGKGKEKEKAKRGGKAKPPTQNSNSLAVETQRALLAKYEHQQQLANATRQRLAGPFTNLQAIEQSPDDDLGGVYKDSSDESSSDEGGSEGEGEDEDEDEDEDEGEDTSRNVTSNFKNSSKELKKLRREHGEMAAALAYYRGHDERDSGTTPGASGSGSRDFTLNCFDAPAAPVARGQPALDPQSFDPPPPPRVPLPPKADSKAHFRHFIDIPKSKTGYKIGKIRRKAGLEHDGPRWRGISDIIRDIMSRVVLDYSNSWANQDGGKLGRIYDMIHAQVPEIADFENGWASEILVQRKFNNRLYNTRKSRLCNATAPVDGPSDPSVNNSAASPGKPKKVRQPLEPFELHLNQSHPSNSPPKPIDQEPINKEPANQEPLHPPPRPQMVRPNEPTRREPTNQEPPRFQPLPQAPHPHEPAPPPLDSRSYSLSPQHHNPAPPSDPVPPQLLSSYGNPLPQPRALDTHLDASTAPAPQHACPLPQMPVRPPESWGGAKIQLASRQSSHESAAPPVPILPRRSLDNSLEPLQPVGPSMISDLAGCQALHEQSRSPTTFPSIPNPPPTPSSSSGRRLRKDWTAWAAKNSVDDGTSRYSLRSNAAAAANALAQTATAVNASMTGGGGNKRKADQLSFKGAEGTKKRTRKGRKKAESTPPRPPTPDDTDSGGRPSTEEDG
ncbi:hypothetical protein FRC11_001740 [Ceratobasidium sp. 423]|nr:hypothetical protein FRC11_001740 [Ceratobasidium sp. 423]